MTAPGADPSGSERPNKPRVWTIEVCRTCGRLAVWPYCSHRPTGFVASGTTPWYEIVTVREVGRHA